MPKAGGDKFDLGLEMIMLCDDLNRSEALEKMGELAISEYAVAFEHKRTA